MFEVFFILFFILFRSFFDLVGGQQRCGHVIEHGACRVRVVGKQDEVAAAVCADGLQGVVVLRDHDQG